MVPPSEMLDATFGYRCANGAHVDGGKDFGRDVESAAVNIDVEPDHSAVISDFAFATLPGHAPGHTGYAFDTDEDNFLFFGDIVHVPALQFGSPAFSWGYDDDQPTARATRLRVFHDAAKAGTWIAGAHLGWPGIGRVLRKGEAYGYEPAAG
jgi:glyoxylase-like metal-dependent hydrolase (beta-lactamase superfamily II)